MYQIKLSAKASKNCSKPRGALEYESDKQMPTGERR